MDSLIKSAIEILSSREVIAATIAAFIGIVGTLFVTVYINRSRPRIELVSRTFSCEVQNDYMSINGFSDGNSHGNYTALRSWNLGEIVTNLDIDGLKGKEQISAAVSKLMIEGNPMELIPYLLEARYWSSDVYGLTEIWVNIPIKLYNVGSKPAYIGDVDLHMRNNYYIYLDKPTTIKFDAKPVARIEGKIQKRHLDVPKLLIPHDFIEINATIKASLAFSVRKGTSKVGFMPTYCGARALLSLIERGLSVRLSLAIETYENERKKTQTKAVSVKVKFLNRSNDKEIYRKLARLGEELSRLGWRSSLD